MKAALGRMGGLLALFGGIAGLIGLVARPFAQNPWTISLKTGIQLLQAYARTGGIPFTPTIGPGWWVCASALLLTLVASVLALIGRGSVSLQKETGGRFSMQDMFCAACGAALPATASFCDRCGTAVDKPQPHEALSPEEQAIKALFLPEHPQTSATALREGQAPMHAEEPATSSSLPTRSSPPLSASPARPGTPSSQDADRVSRRSALGTIAGTIGLGVAACRLLSSVMRLNTALSSHASSTPTINPPPGTITYLGHTAAVVAVAWSPDGTRIASGSQDKTVQVWEAGTGKPLFTYRGHTDEIMDVAWSPTGEQIASASTDRTLQIWTAAAGELVTTFQGSSLLGFPLAIGWSPDGTRIASANADNSVTIWEVATRTRILTYRGHTDPVNGVTWSPDGTRLASSGSLDRTVQICSASTGKALLTYTSAANAMTALAWSPDGKYIASGEGRANDMELVTVEVWAPTTGKQLTTYAYHYDAVNGLAWAHDSTRVASASADGTVQVWTTTGAPRFTYTGHAASVNAVAWAPDDQHLVSGGWDTSVQVWQIPAQ